ncbi:hypothetical protein ACWC2T_10025 [Streptomyces sp. NPDC001393]
MGRQLLDGGLGTLAAATLPTDIVPLLARVLSLLLVVLTGGATAAHARRFRPYLIAVGPTGGVGPGVVGDVGWLPCTGSVRPG